MLLNLWSKMTRGSDRRKGPRGIMRKKIGIIVCGLAVITIAAVAQAGKPKEERRTVTMVLDHTVSNLEYEFVPAAEAMPEDKFNFAPTNGEFKGVRTYAEQIKHVAAVNYELGAALMEEKPPMDLNGEAGPASIKSKAEIIKYLRDSFVYVHKAIATINEGNLTAKVRSPFGDGKVARPGLACSV